MAYIQSGTAYDDTLPGGVGSLAVAFPGNVTAGSLMVLWISRDVTLGQTITSVTDNHSATWTLFTGTQVNNATSKTTGSMYYSLNAAGGATTVTVNLSAASEYLRAVVAEYSGVLTTGAADVATGQTTTNTTAADNATSGATATLAQADELVVSGILDNGSNAALTAGTGYTRRILSAAPVGFKAFLEDKTVAATTAVTGTWTGSVASTYICSVATFKLSSTAADSGPNYAGTASDMGGGSGSWTNPTNAQGAADTTYAVWTSP